MVVIGLQSHLVAEGAASVEGVHQVVLSADRFEGGEESRAHVRVVARVQEEVHLPN